MWNLLPNGQEITHSELSTPGAGRVTVTVNVTVRRGSVLLLNIARNGFSRVNGVMARVSSRLQSRTGRLWSACVKFAHCRVRTRVLVLTAYAP